MSEEEKNSPAPSDFEHLLEDIGSDGSKRRRRHRSSRNPINRITRRLRKRFQFGGIVLGIVVVLVVVLVGLAALLVDASSQLNTAWEGTRRVLDSITSQEGTELTLSDFDRLRSSVDDLGSRMRLAQGRVNLLAPVANLNPDGRAGIEALNAGVELVNAANSMLDGLEPALVFLVAGDESSTVTTGVSSGERAVELFQTGQGRFVTAQEQLQTAKTMLDAIDLDGVSPNLVLLIEQIRDYQSLLDETNQLMFSAPELLTYFLGLDEDRSYLVLAVNNDELRPSGGYLSTYGWFVVRSGRIINYNYDETSAISPNPPRPEFAETFTVPDWWIPYRQPLYAAWDGSWYADFPSTAQLAADYYNAGGNPQAPVDAVISIDLSGFELLLAALGDVLIPEYGRLVNVDNFRSIVYEVREGAHLESDPHKDFLIATYRAIFSEWQAVDEERLPIVLGNLLTALQQRHVMIYFTEPTLNESLDILDWGGVQEAGIDQDYIMVVDANIVGNKANRSILRETTYDATVTSEGLVSGRLSVRYDYSAVIADANPATSQGVLDYRSLNQIFLPVGSQITTTNNVNEYQLVDLDEHTMVTTQMRLPYDSVQRFTYEYTIPDAVNPVGPYQRYRLLIQKQAGTLPETINIQIKLPEGARVVTTSPAYTDLFELEQPTVYFRLETDRDVQIDIIYDTGTN